ncbi:MAG: hypothetical protein KDD56_07970 [Bdellovibrionales bacterium]|nr:hypothetical protein [Bdellovibrionales bacterium]
MAIFHANSPQDFGSLKGPGVPGACTFYNITSAELDPLVRDFFNKAFFEVGIIKEKRQVSWILKPDQDLAEVVKTLDAHSQRLFSQTLSYDATQLAMCLKNTAASSVADKQSKAVAFEDLNPSVFEEAQLKLNNWDLQVLLSRQNRSLSSRVDTIVAANLYLLITKDLPIKNGGTLSDGLGVLVVTDSGLADLDSERTSQRLEGKAVSSIDLKPTEGAIWTALVAA